MKRLVFLGWVLVLVLVLLTGCQTSEEEPFVGATASGALDKEAAGDQLVFNIEVTEEGDPVGIDFRGVLTEGSVKLQLVDADGELYREWEFEEIGPFSLNTTLFPPPGTYRYGMAWEGPVQLAQYSIAWKPFPIEVAEVRPIALLTGVGMVLVALGYIVYALVRKLGLAYLGLGALAWGLTVALKFAWAIPLNAPLYNALTGALPERFANLIFYVYVGALTGVFEGAITWLVLRYTSLGRVRWGRALAFGIGFGAFEALILGLSSLGSVLVALTAPESLPPTTLEQIAQLNDVLFGLAPVWERFFTVLVHVFANVLLFYGAVKRDARWFWLSFAYKTGIDAVAAVAQLQGLATPESIWIIEAIVALWGIAGWFGTRWVATRYPALPAEPDVQPEP
ncbi:MAG: YhfC family glutamic-type intramembrane protease [Anaerolineales bacterium]